MDLNAFQWGTAFCKQIFFTKQRFLWNKLTSSCRAPLYWRTGARGIDSFSIPSRMRSLEEGDTTGTALTAWEATQERMVTSSLLWDNLCGKEWLSEKTDGSGTLRPIFPLKGDNYETTLPLSWADVPVNIESVDPVEVVVEKPISLVNKELFKESPLLLFPTQIRELPNTYKEPDHNYL